MRWSDWIYGVITYQFTIERICWDLGLRVSVASSLSFVAQTQSFRAIASAVGLGPLEPVLSRECRVASGLGRCAAANAVVAQRRVEVRSRTHNSQRKFTKVLGVSMPLYKMAYTLHLDLG